MSSPFLTKRGDPDYKKLSAMRMVVRARIIVAPSSRAGLATTITSFAIEPAGNKPEQRIYPCKEWSIVDDMMCVADTMTFTVTNSNGELSDRFRVGQKVEMDVCADDVSEGRWVRTFTGRITRVRRSSGVSDGSTILITAQDLGWHLTSCHAPPLLRLENKKLGQLIEALIDPTWGFAKDPATSGIDVQSNVLNKRLKQGLRQGIERALAQEQNARTILPYIQVEPGQTPFDVLRPYLAREGLLLNVGARGEVVLFRPDYMAASPYASDREGGDQGIQYHDGRSTVIGTPTIEESLDGKYSTVQCWSMSVNPSPAEERAASENPNYRYMHTTIPGEIETVPFNRLHAFMDGDAISDAMRKNRATWKYTMSLFDSWQYEVDIPGHSMNGAFFTSDEMIPINDSVHGVEGTFYIQRVQRSVTEQGGTRTRLLVRKPLLFPDLEAEVHKKKQGPGAKHAARTR